MKKLNWSGLDFLRRDRGAIARESNSTNSQLGNNQRWSSESKLHISGLQVSHSISDLHHEKKATLSNRGRLSFSDLLRLKRNPAEPGAENKSKSGILDTLKKKFKGNFKIARSEHSRFRLINKRHSFSLSISSISEESSEQESLSKSKTLSSISSVREPCQLCLLPSPLRKLTENRSESHKLCSLSENCDDHNDNIVSTVGDVSYKLIYFFFSIMIIFSLFFYILRFPYRLGKTVNPTIQQLTLKDHYMKILTVLQSQTTAI